MPLDFLFHSRSLKGRLIWTYLVILGIGGLVTSLVGSWIVSSTIMMQAHRSVDHDLSAARSLYDQQLESVKRALQLAASGTTIQQHLASKDRNSLLAYLEPIRKDIGLDFLTLTDPAGRASLRVSNPGGALNDVSSVSVIRAALAGQVAASTEIVSAEFLSGEDPPLGRRAHIRVVTTPRARPPRKTEETAGMVLIAAVPVRAPGGRTLGVLYGGVLLNRNFALVDRLWELVFKSDRFDGQDVGSVTIFQNDVRVSTTVRTADGERAVGTQASAEVHDIALGQGRIFRGRAFVVRDWYISGYDPLRNHEGRIIGMLYVGLLEKAYSSSRDRVILSFFGLATVGFIFIIGVTYYEIRKITLPLAKMVAATQSIAAGRFDQEVHSNSQGEIDRLADSFNTMLQSLRQMKADLEEWARTLEEKVKQRTEELVAMQARVAQSERLASLGLLAAGVAHEINNPLGGILSLTALSLEDMKPDDANRENLEEVVKQTQRCRDIVRGLLEFSRRSEVNTEPADLNKILQDTLSLLERQAQFFNIAVVKNWDRQLPPVMADKSQLQQVFMNILMNAVQAMQEKGTITVTTRHNTPANSVELLISDTGCGIPPGRVDQIFDPFFTTKADGQGTGLGLSIAYGIISAHRGSISVESEIGKGSTFIIRLPVAAAATRETRE